jgi:hypothetical protein
VSAPNFRAELDRLALSQSGLARLMRELGDPREQATLLRSVSNWCRGVVAVPGEMWVVLRLLGERERAPSRRR